MGAGTTDGTGSDSGWGASGPGWGGSVAGWVLFEDDPTWHPSQFRLSTMGMGPRLLITLPDRPDWEIDLEAVTTLVEILGAPEGYHQVEVGVGNRCAQAVWPESFTASVLASLQCTVGSPYASIVEPTPKRARTGPALIGALALMGCGALLVGALGFWGGNSSEPEVRNSVETSTTTTSTSTTVPSTAAPGPCLDNGLPNGTAPGTPCEPN